MLSEGKHGANASRFGPCASAAIAPGGQESLSDARLSCHEAPTAGNQNDADPRSEHQGAACSGMMGTTMFLVFSYHCFPLPAAAARVHARRPTCNGRSCASRLRRCALWLFPTLPPLRATARYTDGRKTVVGSAVHCSAGRRSRRRGHLPASACPGRAQRWPSWEARIIRDRHQRGASLLDAARSGEAHISPDGVLDVLVVVFLIVLELLRPFLIFAGVIQREACAPTADWPLAAAAQ